VRSSTTVKYLMNVERLENERQALRDRERELTAGLSTGDQSGDRADQAQLLEQRNELEWIRDRIAEITQLVAAAAEPPPQPAAPDQIGVGTTASLEYPDGSRETIWLGPAELARDDQVAVTPDSPLGQALMGHQAGDSVDYATPAGPEQVRVLDVRPPRLGADPH
jgi:transcription elongation factor GreA